MARGVEAGTTRAALTPTASRQTTHFQLLPSPRRPRRGHEPLRAAATYAQTTQIVISGLHQRFNVQSARPQGWVQVVVRNERPIQSPALMLQGRILRSCPPQPLVAGPRAAGLHHRTSPTTSYGTFSPRPLTIHCIYGMFGDIK
jgi:hypothetical protein